MSTILKRARPFRHVRTDSLQNKWEAHEGSVSLIFGLVPKPNPFFWLVRLDIAGSFGSYPLTPVFVSWHHSKGWMKPQAGPESWLALNEAPLLLTFRCYHQHYMHSLLQTTLHLYMWTCTVYSVHCALYTVHCTLYAVHVEMYCSLE